MQDEKKVLDADDKLFLKLFLAIPAALREQPWHADCAKLQHKLMGAGDVGYIEDDDWDDAIKFLKTYYKECQSNLKELITKYP